YEAPLESGLKVIFGLTALGFYAASDLALNRERQFREYLIRSGQSVDLSDNFVPYHKKFIAFSIVNILVVSTVILLLIFKDLQWLGANNVPVAKVHWAIFAEILFVFVVCSAYVTRIVLQYANTMSNSLNSQNSVLRQVQSGRTDTSVPVVSNDEFGHMAYFTNQMIAAAAKRRSELFSAQEATVLSLTSLAGVRDNETGMHILRTQHYVRVLAQGLRSVPEYTEKLTDERIDMYFRAAPLHDIGKVGIPDAILKKPGKLTEDEFSIMKNHTVLGVKALEEAKKQIGNSEFLTTAHEIALTHHERWDGKGYPYGLQGVDIPLSGRLMAVADVYDALRSTRVYKQGQSHYTALRTIAKGRGSQFDPDIIEALYACENEIQEISEKFADEELHLASRPLLVYSA
ncbi:MAG: HD-GYP domain-containing protein, partial [Methyloligellaceae bacterium]